VKSQVAPAPMDGRVFWDGYKTPVFGRAERQTDRTDSAFLATVGTRIVPLFVRPLSRNRQNHLLACAIGYVIINDIGIQQTKEEVL
jgi:hypothetical protein